MSHGPDLSRQAPLYRQIALHYAREIADGRLRPGDVLPTTAALAANHQVTLNTAQRAFTVLKQRGLVRRVPRRGTVVSLSATTTTLGLVLGDNIMARPEHSVYRHLWSRLIDAAHRRGLRMRIYPVPARHERCADVVGEIEADLATGRVRALCSLCLSSELGSWFKTSCPAPWVDANMLVRVDDVTRIGYAHLLARGYRRIAWLAPWKEDQGRSGIAAACAQHGIAMPSDPVAGYALTAEAGYAWGRSLAAQPAKQRPQAVLVGNDNACQGVIYACLEAGLRIGQDLALVTHANSGIAPYFPLDLTRVEFDLAGLAATMLDALQQGKSHTLPPCVPTLVTGATCPVLEHA